MLGGWALDAVTGAPEIAIGSLFAVLAGGIVLKLLKKELPEERPWNFGTFAFGMADYAALLMI